MRLAGLKRRASSGSWPGGLPPAAVRLPALRALHHWGADRRLVEQQRHPARGRTSTEPRPSTSSRCGPAAGCEVRLRGPRGARRPGQRDELDAAHWRRRALWGPAAATRPARGRALGRQRLHGARPAPPAAAVSPADPLHPSRSPPRWGRSHVAAPSSRPASARSGAVYVPLMLDGSRALGGVGHDYSYQEARLRGSNWFCLRAPWRGEAAWRRGGWPRLTCSHRTWRSWPTSGSCRRFRGRGATDQDLGPGEEPSAARKELAK